jgi:lipopolysaccharide/colanic/teichoic acid biosynthesis glycosyltransferase
MFRQQRCGRGGKPFSILKFRTMVRDASQLGGHSTKDNDPRITRIGQHLRRMSLDELPQFLNVLSGEMSLVGPRPDTLAQEADYAAEDWAQRCSVRPGITGLAQARYRSSATFEQRLACDLEYARDPSLARDLSIIGQTIARLFKGGSN